MSFEKTFRTLKDLLPEAADYELLENLVLQSSYIVFDEAGETLFREGDPSKGFYWILSGEVLEEVAPDIKMVLRKGSMVGLEEFLETEAHNSHWTTLGRTETLFIDRRCFANFSDSNFSHDLIRMQLATQLLMLKESCNNPTPRVLSKLA